MLIRLFQQSSSENPSGDINMVEPFDPNPSGNFVDLWGAGDMEGSVSGFEGESAAFKPPDSGYHYIAGPTSSGLVTTAPNFHFSTGFHSGPPADPTASIFQPASQDFSRFHHFLQQHHHPAMVPHGFFMSSIAPQHEIPLPPSLPPKMHPGFNYSPYQLLQHQKIHRAFSSPEIDPSQLHRGPFHGSRVNLCQSLPHFQHASASSELDASTPSPNSPSPRSPAQSSPVFSGTPLGYVYSFYTQHFLSCMPWYRRKAKLFFSSFVSFV